MPDYFMDRTRTKERLKSSEHYFHFISKSRAESLRMVKRLFIRIIGLHLSVTDDMKAV